MHYEKALTSSLVHPDLIAQIKCADDSDLVEENGRINAYTNGWRELEIGKIDFEAINWFMHGNCAALALAIHEVIDCQLITLSGLDVPRHAFVQLENSLYLDIEGTKTHDEMTAQWSANGHFEVQVVSQNRDEFIATWGSLDEMAPLESALTRDFALVVQRQYL